MRLLTSITVLAIALATATTANAQYAQFFPSPAPPAYVGPGPYVASAPVYVAPTTSYYAGPAYPYETRTYYGAYGTQTYFPSYGRPYVTGYAPSYTYRSWPGQPVYYGAMRPVMRSYVY